MFLSRFLLLILPFVTSAIRQMLDKTVVVMKCTFVTESQCQEDEYNYGERYKESHGHTVSAVPEESVYLKDGPAAGRRGRASQMMN